MAQSTTDLGLVVQRFESAAQSALLFAGVCPRLQPVLQENVGQAADDPANEGWAERRGTCRRA